MISRICLFLIISTTTVHIEASESNGPEVHTALGTIKGHFIESYGGRKVSAFEGIPYAKPPVGELRFKEPEPADPWSGVFEAKKTYTCLQMMPFISNGILGDEDCLYVYVYVPKETITGSENLSVIVHIHGGGFMVGAPKYLAGPSYIMDKDVVYVTFNYRVGILGFLSTEDEVLPGNNGLKDQTLALKWIQNNIRYFGGNPDSVTITGTSAGGASVHYHFLSPLSKGLFHRGFSQSGTALNSFALTENSLKLTKTLATYLNCTTETTLTMVDCLRNQKGSHLIGTLKNFFVLDTIVPILLFAPVIENGSTAFLPDHPYKLLADGKINDYPWVTSNTKEEGIFPVGFVVLENKLEALNDRWESVLPTMLDYTETVPEENHASLAKNLREHYLNNETLSMENLDKLINMFSDRIFLYDAETAIRLQSKIAKSPVYYYSYEYKITNVFFKQPELHGAAHGDDGRLLFKHLFDPKVLSPNDQDMKDVLVDFLYDFATKSVPQMNGVVMAPVEENEEINYIRVISPTDIYNDRVQRLTTSNFWENVKIMENEKLFHYT